MDSQQNKKRQSIKSFVVWYISTWEQRCYSDGLPDEVPCEIMYMAPSYKLICLAILKNDISILGAELPKSEYYDMLKHIELKAKGKIKQKQLKLF